MAKKSESEKPGFLIRHKYRETLKELEDCQRGRLLLYLLNYSEYEEEPEKDGSAEYFIFKIIKSDIDQDRENYLNVRKKNKENAEKRWHKNQDTPNDITENSTVVCDRMRPYADDANRIDREKKGIDINSSSLKRESKERDFHTPTLKEIKQYQEKIGSRVDCEKFFNHYESIDWIVNGSPVSDWKARFRNWWKNDQSKEKEQIGAHQKKTNGFSNFAERKATNKEIDELEHSLVKNEHFQVSRR